MATQPAPYKGEATSSLTGFSIRIPARLAGIVLALAAFLLLAALSSWSVDDPSFSYATDALPKNWLGHAGAIIADLGFQIFGLASMVLAVPPLAWGWTLFQRKQPTKVLLRVVMWLSAALLSAGLMSCLPTPDTWPLPTGLGGLVGSGFSNLAAFVSGEAPKGAAAILYGLILIGPAAMSLYLATGLRAASVVPPKPETTDPLDDNSPDRTGFFDIAIGGLVHLAFSARTAFRRAVATRRARAEMADEVWKEQAAPADHAELQAPHSRIAHDEPSFDEPAFTSNDRREPSFGEPNVAAPYTEDASAHMSETAYEDMPYHDIDEADLYPADQDQPVAPIPPSGDQWARQSVESAPSITSAPAPASQAPRVTAPAARPAPGKRVLREAQGSLLDSEGFELPALDLLTEPHHGALAPELHPDKLEENARRLEGVLEDFGVKGDIINVRPGPVVTLYELEPAPGIKSSRVISLADDIARSMSAISARVAVVPGRNAIGIELPNANRETVFLKEMLASADFEKMKGKLNICLGKTIGGEPVIADLARMPHLLVAGTTGSGKSVAVNTMILSILYKMTPEQCRLIMIDPKMLELSIYDGIPHLLTPVVTDPSKAVVALKWAVREMEDRYRKMSKIGVRNIDGFNQRVGEAAKKGEVIKRTVQTGFDRETGEAIYEHEEFDLEPLPYIVIIVDEMADLMMVAGKDIEGAIQRLAQMARAAGIHLVMATQRPSVDVITGTIKANFPTRISFQVTSKIDSRTILGEQGAEQLLGMGDMLYMAGGGRTRRLHGPFVSDGEVEDVVSHLKSQGTPDYLESITTEDEEETGSISETGEFSGSGDELYDKAVNIVLNDGKASTSYIQRRLSIGYNRAATLIEKMENEGVISAANHAGKREILVGEHAAGY
jgi:S-DNA-T family DNA segregation ATPase FtsK/SpoIIIE